MIERKILIALITQTEYLRQIQSEWNTEFIESATAKLIAGWCWEYFREHHKAPMYDIENIYIDKLRSKEKPIGKELAEEIEQEIFPGLAQEYEKGNINVTYLLKQTRKYFTERQITLHNEALTALLSKNKIKEAKREIEQFRFSSEETENELDLSSENALNKLESAFDETYQNVISFPGALGDFWNDQLVRGALVAILAPEKRGKTFWLLEFMMRAYAQGRKVAFFQAGDMTENQQIIRIAIYLAQKSNKEKYCGIKYIPVQDCVKNQLDTCNKRVRECSFGVFNQDEGTLRTEVNLEKLKKAYEENTTYKPCYNCVEWTQNKWGIPWVKKVNIEKPLGLKEAKTKWKRFFIKTKREIKLSTHVNGTLTIEKIKAILEKWRKDEFLPDVILIDYADLIVYEGPLKDFRHQQNYIWKELRALSQEYNCLVIPPTQADANSYTKDRLGLDNFSEDKRKFAHVTAMYGLNQDTQGREKELGVMRINKIVIREGDFHQSHEVFVLQKLDMGRPFLGSFY